MGGALRKWRHNRKIRKAQRSKEPQGQVEKIDDIHKQIHLKSEEVKQNGEIKSVNGVLCSGVAFNAMRKYSPSGQRKANMRKTYKRYEKMLTKYGKENTSPGNHFKSKCLTPSNKNIYSVKFHLPKPMKDGDFYPVRGPITKVHKKGRQRAWYRCYPGKDLCAKCYPGETCVISFELEEEQMKLNKQTAVVTDWASGTPGDYAWGDCASDAWRYRHCMNRGTNMKSFLGDNEDYYAEDALEPDD